MTDAMTDYDHPEDWSDDWVITDRSFISACLGTLELSLRWLHDRAFWIGMHRTGDTCYTCGKYIDIEQEIDALELGLRWLHDRASRCSNCYAMRVYRWADGTIGCVACDELGPI